MSEIIQLGGIETLKSRREWEMRKIHILFTVARSENSEYLQMNCLFLQSCIASLQEVL